MLTRRGFVLGMVAGARVAAGGAEMASLPLTFVVEAGKYDRSDVPISMTLPGDLKSGRQLRLLELRDGREIATPLQWEQGRPLRAWWIVRGAMPKGSVRRYRLQVGPPEDAAGLRTVKSERFLEIQKEKAPILRYNTAHIQPPKGIDPSYGRSAHLHPVWTPRGTIVTDETPPDHAHQSGVFLAFTRAVFEGHDVNFWDLKGGKGRVRFKKILATTGGPVYGGFQVEQEHVDLTVPGSKLVLVEGWDVRAWNLGGARAGSYVWDVGSTIRCAGESALKLPQFPYGGMALRGARSWSKETSRVLTSDGKGREEGNHTRPRWCDLSGRVDGKTTGITLLTHPANFRFPEPLRIHPSMPYMVYTPSHLGDWEIRPGKAHVARYRFVVHDGPVVPAEVERLWRDFAEPPVVRR
ncbi:MAG: PmoA family protein [Planctomycetes bacterium]|nr:PmoA family protein [Planctomycetota bacterium]